MSVQPATAGETARPNIAAMRFVRSKMFTNIFTEGMKLVEETASYLDGDGREAARGLGRTEALAYAGLSMRLTTRLMQIASWLLVMRAVREEDMTYDEAAQDKYRFGSPEPDDEPMRRSRKTRVLDLTGQPERLLVLRESTHRLYERITRIDTELFEGGIAVAATDDAASRLRALQQAFPGTMEG